jgi:uncharacterized repeat protein (TIGR03806 family)
VKQALAALGIWGAAVSASAPPPVDDALIIGETLPPTLSAFHLLLGRQGQTPNAGVTPYKLNTPLFSDYAEKFRYAYVPKGKTIAYRADGVLEFPVGAVLVKSFGYPADFRAPDKDVRIIETRLLIRRSTGWIALPYVWNADGSDAVLKRAGTRVDVSWTHTDGVKRAISYAVPNVNQCKDCHALDGVMTPIGPKARNLSDSLFTAGLVRGAPASFTHIPVWSDAGSGTVAARARAYLDVNCGHCHNAKGAASNSGLWLTWDEANPVTYGVNKRSVAAGRGGGSFAFDIAPGHPDQSILIYRLASVDPGIAMPELGRATAHEEGLALLRQWIAEMPAK